VEPHESDELKREWDTHDLDVPLVVLDSPYREVTRPVLDYIWRVRRESPRDVVTVVIPEHVLGRWWLEAALHRPAGPETN
jgi:hypothetical protein